MLHVINTMEFWVEKCMAEVIAKSDVCTCDKCLKDIYALTLNRLKPNYIISTKGINSKELDSKFEIVKDTIIDQIKISIDKIKNNPSHNKDHIESVANCAEIYVEEYVPKIIEESDMCKCDECINEVYKFLEIIYVFLTIFLYLLKCPQSLILSALRAFCFCGKPHISRSIFLYFRYQTWLKSW